MDVDILVPAALEGVITERNARSIPRETDRGGSQWAHLPEADDILFHNGQHLISGHSGKLGRRDTSYLEWVQKPPTPLLVPGGSGQQTRVDLGTCVC